MVESRSVSDTLVDVPSSQGLDVDGHARICRTRARATRNSEVAYDRQSHIGKLDKGWDEAVAQVWTVVSMKEDWKTVFPPAIQ